MLVALLAAINFLFGLGEPGQPVWDESYYLTTVQRYEDGRAQFASHPPLGLMLIAAGDAILHPNRGIDTRPVGRDKKIAGEALPHGYSFTGVRLMSGVFAVIGALLFFTLLVSLTGSIPGALVFSNLYLFENAFIAHFRAAHLDAFQIAFTLLALLCCVAMVRRGLRSFPGLALAFGAACGLAIMVKLNAVVLLLLGLMPLIRRIGLGWRAAPRWPLLATAARDGVLMSVGCALSVIAVFTVHVATSPRPPDILTPAGTKDRLYVSTTYSAYLYGDAPLSAGVVFAAAKDYARFMSDDFTGMTRSDPNGSAPLLWPLHERAINYRWDSAGPWTAYVQLAGNPFAWSLALAAPVAALVLLLLQWLRPRLQLGPSSASSSGSASNERRDLMVMLLVQYAAFMAVHIYLGTHRVMYLYHYFIGLLLAFCLLPLVLAEVIDRWPGLRTRREPVLAGMTVLLLVSFVFYSPLSFHQPLTHAQCERRNVLQHIVDCR